MFDCLKILHIHLHKEFILSLESRFFSFADAIVTSIYGSQ